VEKGKRQLHLAADLQEGFFDELEHELSGDPTPKASPQFLKVTLPPFLPSHTIC